MINTSIHLNCNYFQRRNKNCEDEYSSATCCKTILLEFKFPFVLITASNELSVIWILTKSISIFKLITLPQTILSDQNFLTLTNKIIKG